MASFQEIKFHITSDVSSCARLLERKPLEDILEAGQRGLRCRVRLRVGLLVGSFIATVATVPQVTVAVQQKLPVTDPTIVTIVAEDPLPRPVGCFAAEQTREADAVQRVVGGDLEPGQISTRGQDVGKLYKLGAFAKRLDDARAVDHQRQRGPRSLSSRFLPYELSSDG